VFTTSGERVRLFRIGATRSFTWGRKQIQLPKCCAFKNIRQWTSTKFSNLNDLWDRKLPVSYLENKFRVPSSLLSLSQPKFRFLAGVILFQQRRCVIVFFENLLDHEISGPFHEMALMPLPIVTIRSWGEAYSHVRTQNTVQTAKMIPKSYTSL
jgi:hypothetical protein